jgi:hypothetical protein
MLSRLALACIVLFAAPSAMAVDCAAIRAACIDQCQNRAGATGQLNPVTGNLGARVEACINRCSIAPCQQTPLSARLCDATGQRICNTGFQSCNNTCIPSTATTAAQIQSQPSCSTFCCTKFKQCLSNRQCDISTITAINCSETQSF